MRHCVSCRKTEVPVLFSIKPTTVTCSLHKIDSRNFGWLKPVNTIILNSKTEEKNINQKPQEKYHQTSICAYLSASRPRCLLPWTPSNFLPASLPSPLSNSLVSFLSIWPPSAVAEHNNPSNRTAPPHCSFDRRKAKISLNRGSSSAAAQRQWRQIETGSLYSLHRQKSSGMNAPTATIRGSIMLPVSSAA